MSRPLISFATEAGDGVSACAEQAHFRRIRHGIALASLLGLALAAGPEAGAGEKRIGDFSPSQPLWGRSAQTPAYSRSTTEYYSDSTFPAGNVESEETCETENEAVREFLAAPAGKEAAKPKTGAAPALKEAGARPTNKVNEKKYSGRKDDARMGGGGTSGGKKNGATEIVNRVTEKTEPLPTPPSPPPAEPAAPPRETPHDKYDYQPPVPEYSPPLPPAEPEPPTPEGVETYRLKLEARLLERYNNLPEYAGRVTKVTAVLSKPLDYSLDGKFIRAEFDQLVYDSWGRRLTALEKEYFVVTFGSGGTEQVRSDPSIRVGLDLEKTYSERAPLTADPFRNVEKGTAFKPASTPTATMPKWWRPNFPDLD